MTAPRVQLHIGELVVSGFPSMDGKGVAGAIEGEITRLFVEHGVPRSLGNRGALSRLDVEAFEVAPSASARRIGEQVAQSVYRGLGR